MDKSKSAGWKVKIKIGKIGDGHTFMRFYFRPAEFFLQSEQSQRVQTLRPLAIRGRAYVYAFSIKPSEILLPGEQQRRVRA
jgi:hypothetical protein